MRVRTKLIVLTIFLISLFIGIFFIFRHLESQTLVLFFQNAVTEKRSTFNKLYNLEGRSLETFASDYSIWTEMAEYVSSGDQAWADLNLNQDTLSTFSANAVWVYKPDLTLHYYVNNLGNDTLNELSLPPDFFSKLSKDKFAHFFIRTSPGLMEIRGATIVETEDVQRASLRGYFLAGRLLSSGYMADMSLLLGSEVRIKAHRDDPKSRDADYLSQGQVSFSLPLNSWDGSSLAYLNVKSVSNEIKYFKKRSQGYFLFFVLFGVLSIGLGTLLLWRWVGLPLELVSLTLKTENPNYLDRVKDLRNEYGDIASLIVNFFAQRSDLLRQIKERIDTELTLQRRSEELQVILDSVPAMVFYKDTQNRFVRINKAFEDTMGLPKQQLEGRDLGEIYPPEQAEAYFKDDKEVIASGVPKRNIVEPMQTKNGLRLLQSDKVPYRDKDGKIIGIIGFAVDITEQKKAEEDLKVSYEKLKEAQDQLIQSEKMEVVGKIASGIAHEVKNPLAIILQGIDYLQSEKDITANKVAEELLDKMNNAVLRADNIVKSLLNFSSLTEVNMLPVSISALLESSVLLVRHYCVKNHIEIIRDFKDVPAVKVDSNKMEQVFVNLLMNAIEAMPEGGHLTLRVYPDHVEAGGNAVGMRKGDLFKPGEKIAVVRIEDSGAGVLEENIDKVFDPFFSTKRDKGGTGLGLSVVKNIIDMHKGTIDIGNKAGGGGAAVTLKFKIYERRDHG
ncbi:MAG: PAS domain-containing protein [Candidatus Omnitrophica bacterium]|nr:PAS domain-containing protein [Candidatus Omnitrophota bacterium]